jgi:predicted nucleic acid binding AN1-type Zn finger protein
MKQRNRICDCCGFQFTTEMQLPDNCTSCNASDSFDVTRTERTRQGIFRLYRCRCCGKTEKAMETFPILEDNRKRPDLRY